MKLYNKKSAFTLAEVLITLGIIGIVAAMTLPIVISNKEKSEIVSRLQKSYSTISQAYQYGINENGPVTFPNSMGAQEIYEIWFKPYLNAVKQCSVIDKCGYN